MTKFCSRISAHTADYPYADHQRKNTRRFTGCQQDDPPYHYHNDVTSYLNADALVWIGLGCVIQWPP
ncbi:hypothetical protein TNCV_2478371 [Trichonephila clavipes]|nr:hypothetical protein TNCV_2478371 [Trichonephila clavipes]